MQLIANMYSTNTMYNIKINNVLTIICCVFNKLQIINPNPAYCENCSKYNVTLLTFFDYEVLSVKVVYLLTDLLISDQLASVCVQHMACGVHSACVV